MAPHPDLALAARCRRNEPGAFEALYRAHAPRLFGLACRMVGRGDAEDLLQDIFLTAHRKLALYSGDASLGTWLFRMGTNVCLDYLRGRAGRFAKFDDPLDDFPELHGTAGPIAGVVDRIDLEYAIAQLPDGLRVVLVLHDVEGLEHQEVGALVGIAEGTSKSQLHRARKRLRALLARPTSISETRQHDGPLHGHPESAE